MSPGIFANGIHGAVDTIWICIVIDAEVIGKSFADMSFNSRPVIAEYREYLNAVGVRVEFFQFRFRIRMSVAPAVLILKAMPRLMGDHSRKYELIAVK